jgi:lipopolysaccharide export system protein LptC
VVNLHLRRSRIDRLVAWSPLLILAAVAALTFWLDAQVRSLPLPGNGSIRHDPDMIMEDFSAVNLGPDGNVRQRLRADRAQHYPDDGTTEMTRPVFIVTEPDKPRLELSADRGRISGDREDAYFYGNVRAERGAASPDQPLSGPMSLTSEYLHVVPHAHRFSTDKPVTITEPRAIIRGTGLEYDHDSRTLRILSSVSGEFTQKR